MERAAVVKSRDEGNLHIKKSHIILQHDVSAANGDCNH